MDRSAFPPADRLVYRENPISGNVVNGLGETEPRRPDYVFHSTAKTGPLPWDTMQAHFRYSFPLRALPYILRTMWAAFRPQGAIAAQRREVGDPVAMTAEVKHTARELGAGIVGVCELKEEHLMAGANPAYRYAISCGLPMDRDIMLEAPSLKASLEVQRVYHRCSRLTVDMARHLRSLGWPALGLPINSSSEYLHIPIAISAGLGQLGKHGSLISKEYGSNFRLTTILTDLPLAVNAPVDIGVDDMCLNCQACSKACPPLAIYDEKKWVRGVQKWYVDFDRCTPYFSDNYGCAICLEACPWSVPGYGPKLSRLMLGRRAGPSMDESEVSIGG